MMATEIERKFLVDRARWHPADSGVHFVQGYLSTVKERVVRVRIEGPRATLTVKGLTTGVSRAEFEYPIPIDDARELLARVCEQPVLDKHRYREHHDGLTWEIDVFHGENEGLVVAEVELPSADVQPPRPPWIGRDVSGEARYFNSNLIAHPYRTWRQD